MNMVMLKMVKNIVFDMGGVLLDLDVRRTIAEHFPEEYREDIVKNVFYGEQWRLMDAGLMRPDDAKEILLPRYPQELRPLLGEMINNFYPYMPPIKETEQLIARIKKAGYKIYLLSNATPRVFDEYHNIPALAYMDGMFISALYKLLKPGSEIYNAFCDRFSLKAEECFFIDDMEQNIIGARACGMKGFVFDTRDFTALEKALNDEGVFF